MINIKNTQRKFKINTEKFKKDAEKIIEYLGYKDFDLGVWFTSNKTIRWYNKTYRNKDVPTDVLSFPYHQIKSGQKIKIKTEDDKALGDLIISPNRIQKDAEILKISFQKRLDHILVHGICHLLGYDHYTTTEDKKMRKLEDTLLNLIK